MVVDAEPFAATGAGEEATSVMIGLFVRAQYAIDVSSPDPVPYACPLTTQAFVPTAWDSVT